MKAVFLALIVALAVAVAEESPSSPVFNYHVRYGVPRAMQLKSFEETTSRIVGGSVTGVDQTPYQVRIMLRFSYLLLFIFDVFFNTNKPSFDRRKAKMWPTIHKYINNHYIRLCTGTTNHYILNLGMSCMISKAI